MRAILMKKKKVSFVYGWLDESWFHNTDTNYFFFHFGRALNQKSKNHLFVKKKSVAMDGRPIGSGIFFKF